MYATTGTVIGLSLLAVGTIFAITKIFDDPKNTTQNQTPQDVEFLQLIDANGPEVQFVLFTRNNSPYALKLENYTELNRSGFDSGNPTKIITHGFMSSIKNDVFGMIKNAYLEIGDYNVIGMDWSLMCHSEYVSAMRGAKIAGKHLGDFINWLASNGVNLDDIHLIGHSLGAHVAGIAGDSLENGKVGRITGLDPAGPGYGDMKEELRLDPQDAMLVDVIHTFMNVIGTARPTGHIDFYPNGGRYQPGCPDLTSLKVTDSIFCNHGRSFELFAESIRNPRSFKCRRCKSLEDALDSRCLEDTDVYMGQEQTYKNGLYYFKTRSKPPYSVNSKNMAF